MFWPLTRTLPIDGISTAESNVTTSGRVQLLIAYPLMVHADDVHLDASLHAPLPPVHCCAHDPVSLDSRRRAAGGLGGPVLFVVLFVVVMLAKRLADLALAAST